MPLSALTRAHIVAGREDRAKTPSQANNFLNTMRALFTRATETELVAADPTRDVKSVKRPPGEFHAWTEAEIDQFEAKWPVGTRERLAFAILLYTGLRRGDAAALERPAPLWAELEGDSRIGEILIQPAGWAEASRRWQSGIRRTCAIG